MAIITLTSDWGLKDYYLAAVKGSILSQLPDVTIVDVSHEIPSFDLIQTSFVIKNVFRNFPKGTVHIISTNSEASIETPHMAILYEGHYFIGADNGIFSLIVETEPEKIIELNVVQDSDYYTFSTRDVFVKAACHLVQGKKITALGEVRKKLNTLFHFEPTVESNAIKGIIQYIDSYENAITNIKESLFKQVIKNKPFTIDLRSNKITKLSRAYQDVPVGEVLALFGSNGLLEIAINQGNAASLLGLRISDPIRIIF